MVVWLIHMAYKALRVVKYLNTTCMYSYCLALNILSNNKTKAIKINFGCQILDRDSVSFDSKIKPDSFIIKAWQMLLLRYFIISLLKPIKLYISNNIRQPVFYNLLCFLFLMQILLGQMFDCLHNDEILIFLSCFYRLNVRCLDQFRGAQ